LTKVTRVPAGTVSVFGETPLVVSVNVVPPLVPPPVPPPPVPPPPVLPPPDGDVGVLDPHAVTAAINPMAAKNRRTPVTINKTSSRY
jgi:hypothetical protein